MIISNITPPQVWSSSSRSLTNFGSSALAAASTVSTSIAGAASVDLRSSVGVVGVINVAALTGAAATGAVAIFEQDGTNQIQLAISTAAANVPTGWFGVSTSSTGLKVLNEDATHAATYIASQFLLTI